MSPILTRPELISIVNSKYGWTKEEINEVLDSTVDYIHHLIHEKNEPSVFLPYVGAMMFYVREFNVMEKRYSIRKRNNQLISAKFEKYFSQLKVRFMKITEHYERQLNLGKVRMRKEIKHFKNPYMQYRRLRKLKIEYMEELQNNR